MIAQDVEKFTEARKKEKQMEEKMFKNQLLLLNREKNSMETGTENCCEKTRE